MLLTTKKQFRWWILQHHGYKSMQTTFATGWKGNRQLTPFPEDSTSVGRVQEEIFNSTGHLLSENSDSWSKGHPVRNSDENTGWSVHDRSFLLCKKQKKKKKTKTSSRYIDKRLGEEVCKKNFSQIHLEGYYHDFTETAPDRKKKVLMAWRLLNKRFNPYWLWMIRKCLINTSLHSNPTLW